MRLNEALGGQGQQLGDRFDIPIGQADADMAQIGGELRQLSLNLESRAVPLDEPSRREGVTVIPRAG